MILASQSPRRRELLEKAGYQFGTYPVKLSEIIDKNLNLEEALKKLSRDKVLACLDQNKQLKSKGFLVLGADTEVALEGEFLGKPKNLDQAREFLNRLSDKSHSVMTAIALLDVGANRWVQDLVRTEVQFKKLSAAEIERYVQSGEPMDKAGGYAIQGLGKNLVEGFKGSWTNVVGLPMERFEELMSENDWKRHCKPAQQNS